MLSLPQRRRPPDAGDAAATARRDAFDAHTCRDAPMPKILRHQTAICHATHMPPQRSSHERSVVSPNITTRAIKMRYAHEREEMRQRRRVLFSFARHAAAAAGRPHTRRARQAMLVWFFMMRARSDFAPRVSYFCAV